jgi:exosortase
VPDQTPNIRGSNAVVGWLRANPLAAAVVAVIVLTLLYFFGFVGLFPDPGNGIRSTFVWAWHSWNPLTNYEHAKLIPLIVVVLVWYSRKRLFEAPIGSSRWGWLFIGIGLVLFLAGARSLQARLSLSALPFLLFGIVLYAAGRNVARVLLFPIAFLFFMVPLNFITQSTTGLQAFETHVASKICNLLGVGVYALGNTISASNDAFHFNVDEGCSGIRSLMAIAMLSALYGHFTQDRLWKKLAIFAASIAFAIIGNAGRLTSIVLVGRFFGQDLAGGPYHAISGYLSFPFALAAMVLFGKLLNLNPKPSVVKPPASALPKETVSYDY